MTYSSAPAALCLTFDNMGSAQAVGLGQLGRKGPADVGPEGYPEALQLLDRLGIKATFFIEGWNALHNPAAIHRIVARGHDVAMHGWVHEVIHQLGQTQVDRVLQDAFAAFRNIGVTPTGFRAPGGIRGEFVLPILRDLGVLYDSSIDHGPNDDADALASPPRLLKGGIPTVPWQWQNIDYYHYAMYPTGPRSPAELQAFLLDKIDRLSQRGGVETFIFHAFVSCQDPARIDVLNTALGRALDLGIEIVTAKTIADRVLLQP